MSAALAKLPLVPLLPDKCICGNQSRGDDLRLREGERTSEGLALPRLEPVKITLDPELELGTASTSG